MVDNGHRFQPGVNAALADPHLLKTQTEFICKLCHKVFTVSQTGNTQRTARRHVVSVHLDIDKNDFLLPDCNNPDNIYVNNFEELDVDDLLHEAETGETVAESFPAVLFGLIYIRFGFSEREADALLRLLKLNLDYSGIKNAQDVLRLVGVANATEHAACRECESEGHLEKNELTCTSGW